METEKIDRRECLGHYDDCANCQGCQEEDDCFALKEIARLGYQKRRQPILELDYLISPFNAAYDEAWGRYPDESDKHKQQRKKLILSRLNKAKEYKARELDAESREVRREANRMAEEAVALRGSGPKADRFPWGWMRDAAKAARGAKVLVQLIMLTKEIAKKQYSDRLIEELVASGRYKREELGEHYVDKNGKAGIWPAALIQMDYGLAMSARGWTESKTNRLMRRACEDNVFQAMGRIGPNGQMIYCIGVWMGFSGKVKINWFFINSDYWKDVFRKFKCT